MPLTPTSMETWLFAKPRVTPTRGVPNRGHFDMDIITEKIYPRRWYTNASAEAMKTTAGPAEVAAAEEHEYSKNSLPLSHLPISGTRPCVRVPAQRVKESTHRGLHIG